MELTIAQRRVGTDEKSPETIHLKAGALTADFEAGGLRTIRYNGREVLRAIAYVVRDKDWGTYNPAISDFTCRQDSDQFTVTFRARCSDAGQELNYETRITGNVHGLVTFDVTAEPRTPFLTARCGFAVLHPLEGIVGQPAVIEHVDGSREHARFPDLIEPAQPFKDIRAIEHQVAPGITARCRMTGDIFEMEDQRNWSDASYKTYVRPLALPWPYIMESGVRNEQSVELLITDSHAGGRPATAEEAKINAPVEVTIGGAEGIFPRIGVAIDPREIATVLAHPSVLKNLLPQLLLFHFDPTAGHKREDLAGFREIAEISPESQCAFELVLPAQRNVKEELREIAAMAAEARMNLSAVLVSPAVDRQSTLPGSVWPPCPPLAEIYHAAREAFPGAAIGGGILTYFTELNRKRPPVDLLDFVSHCTCPIVHAADDLSVMQTLEAMASITRSARAIIGKDKPYWVGPSTIGMRQNPYGSRVMDNPAHRRITMTDHDPRQTSLFAAAWMIGYAASTAEARLQALTIGSLTGPLGLASVSTAGEVTFHPAFHTAQGLARMGGHPRYSYRSSQPDAIAAVAGTDRDGNSLAWVANLTGRNQAVNLAGDRAVSGIQVLDEENFSQPGVIGVSGSIELRPYAVASVTFAKERVK